ncbi:Protein O-mannosyltransferase 1, partial [Geodia barretti]
AGYVNYSAQFVPHLEWRLVYIIYYRISNDLVVLRHTFVFQEVPGVPDGSPVFHEKGKLKLKLIHEHSKQTLACTGKRLPEWAFQQYEVVTERDVSSTTAVWSLDDVVLPPPSNATAWAEEERLIREKAQNPGTGAAKSEDEDDDSQETLNFWEKYVELQVHMATAHGNLGEHQFGATPHNWPLMGKLLPYWLDEKSNAQVTLIGNPVMWWVASVGIVVFLAVTAVHLLRRRREIFDLPHAEFHQWWTSGSVLLVGWLAHCLPYFSRVVPPPLPPCRPVQTDAPSCRLRTLLRLAQEVPRTNLSPLPPPGIPPPPLLLHLLPRLRPVHLRLPGALSRTNRVEKVVSFLGPSPQIITR